MAGIGFELKKIFKKGGIVNTVKGAFYASMTTIGPLVMIIVSLLVMYIFLDYADLSFAQRDLMASTMLYAFIFSLLLTSPFNSVLSRYIADKIYESKLQDIMPSYYVGLSLNIGLAGIVGIPFCLREYFVGGIDPFYILASYVMFVALMISFFNMTYISAVKDYKKISIAFLIGMGIALLLAFFLVKGMGIGLDEAIIYSFAVGFTIIATILYAIIRAFFTENSRNYREPLSYFGKFKGLFFVNLFYTLGLYSHNFIYWQKEGLRVVVADCFVSAPIYDLATCIAMFINISTMVIFVVQVETDFHDRYALYCEAVIGGTHRDIMLRKGEMLDTMQYKLSFIFQFQFLINVILYLMSIILLPGLGISGPVIEMLPSLTVGYFAVFIMYCVIVFLYYFEDTKGALLTSFSFLAVTAAGSVLGILLEVEPGLYGTGLFLGGVIGFTIGYFRIRKVEKNLEEHIFCRGSILPGRQRKRKRQ